MRRSWSELSKLTLVAINKTDARAKRCSFKFLLDLRYVEADTEFVRYGLASPGEQAKLLSNYVEPDVLVLDDLFLARRITDVSAEVLQAIVHQRYKLRRSIIATSNRIV